LTVTTIFTWIIDLLKKGNGEPDAIGFSCNPDLPDPEAQGFRVRIVAGCFV
jgi:hypothetical protein